MDAAYVLIGFIFLMGGGEGLVQGAVRISSRLQIPPLLVGFTVVAVGTSLPELAVALEAVKQNSPEIAVGGVIGSNVANVMLVLGTAAVLGVCSDPDQGIKRDSVAVMVATLVLLAIVLIGELSRMVGFGMVIALGGYYWYAYIDATRTGEEVEVGHSWLPDRLDLAIPSCIAGGWMIWIGAELLVKGATGIAESYGISEAVIGLSMVALGTSLPELAVTLVAGLRGQGGVAIGNVLGSNVINILGILGLTAIIGGGLGISGSFAERDVWVVLATSGAIAGMLLGEREIGKGIGSTMIFGYLSYIIILYL
ncbi:MAG: calcium/sodium antiporter [Candidatus Thalassarchaeaceae archaeon]|nr:calcium/sodium antiporter [Candidatus Thalassarchaeaceae archaeon]MDP7091949.1 calcium/sodium antiporter [Candidatus Thalassarchaeaceae archaeon]MDP7257201.1 calcium/sodium antiporter [Candidatus Thalassarchaeaceae archaeon]MDP7446183.1 calcium/sodium antiporter [Candidatus Thalassarchaeaceae archaeon]HJM76933.1 calcium/sodium antiporter [Candidatus Thalassarchaeaceae archaeon]